MRKTLFLGIAAAFAITATAWATFSYRPASLAPPGLDITAIHQSVDTAALPIAPVADYHVD